MLAVMGRTPREELGQPWPRVPALSGATRGVRELNPVTKAHNNSPAHPAHEKPESDWCLCRPDVDGSSTSAMLVGD